MNTLVSFRSASPGFAGQFSVGVNSQVVASPAIVEKIRVAGFEPVPGDSIEKFSTTIHEDYVRYGRIIKETGIRLD